MTDIALITQSIAAASAGVKLIDQISDQVTSFIQKRPWSGTPSEHRMLIEGEGDRFVEREHGQVVKTITADDLKSLPEDQLRNVQAFEKSMEAHHKIWASVYPQLATMDSAVQKAKVELQLQGIVQDMKRDFVGILDFLESCGFDLDDHYQAVRYVVANA
jgi:hypothetical protein